MGIDRKREVKTGLAKLGGEDYEYIISFNFEECLRNGNYSNGIAYVWNSYISSVFGRKRNYKIVKKRQKIKQNI